MSESNNTTIVDEFGLPPKENEKPRKAAFKGTGHQILVTLGLIFGIFIGGLSETAVSTLTEVIGQDFKSFGSLTWIAGAYLLTTVAFTPLFGKVSDIFGRKPVELFSITLFAIGSLGCALSTSMTMLIIFRAIAGIGGGGLLSLSFIMVSDVIPIENRSTYLGIISTTFAISQIVGPIIGGALAEVNWRIIFYIQLPFCGILAILVIFVLDLPKSQGNIIQKAKRVDFLGSITLILTIVALILATNWGGKDYSWNSAPIIVLLVLMVLFFISFVCIQWKVAPEPVLPSRVFVRNVICSNIALFMGGAVNMVIIFYLPIYFQTVHDLSPGDSGYRLAPFLGILSVVCLISGYLAQIFKTIRGIMFVGSVINLVGVCLVTFIRQNSTLAEQFILVMICGIGLGCNFQLGIFMSSLSVAPEDVAIVTGFTTFSLNIGGVIALAIVGSVYNTTLLQRIQENLPEVNAADILQNGGARLLTSAQQEVLKYCYHEAFRYGMICIIPFAILMVIALLGLTKQELPKKSDMPAVGH
jgi:MFS family permease